MKITRVLPLAVVLLGTISLPACQTLREVANLRNVDFAIDRVAQARLAGVELDRIRSYDDLRTTDVLRLTAALADGRMPLDFTLHLMAENPESNSVAARLVEMDWTLFLEDRETVSGVFTDEIVLDPGQPRDIPISIRLDLVDFFDRSAQDLVELALAVSGQGGAPKEVSLRARPTIQTPIGPIRYPEPIQIVSRTVGGP